VYVTRAELRRYRDVLRDMPPVTVAEFISKYSPDLLRALRRIGYVDVRGGMVVSRVHSFMSPDRVLSEFGNDHVSGYLRKVNRDSDFAAVAWNPGRFSLPVRDLDRKYFTVMDRDDLPFANLRRDDLVRLASLRVHIGRALESLVYDAVSRVVNRVARRLGVPVRFSVYRNVTGDFLRSLSLTGPYFRFWVNALARKDPSIIDFLYSDAPYGEKLEYIYALVRRWLKRAFPNLTEFFEPVAPYKHDVDVLVLPAPRYRSHEYASTWGFFRVMFEVKNWSPTRALHIGELFRYINTANLIGALPALVATSLSPEAPSRKNPNLRVRTLPLIFRGLVYQEQAGLKKSYFRPSDHFLWCYKPRAVRGAKTRALPIAISGQLIVPIPIIPPLYKVPWTRSGANSNYHVREYSTEGHAFALARVVTKNPVLSRYSYLPLQSKMYIPEDIYWDNYDFFYRLGYVFDANVEVDYDVYMEYLEPQVEHVLTYFMLRWYTDYIVKYKKGVGL